MGDNKKNGGIETAANYRSSNDNNINEILDSVNKLLEEEKLDEADNILKSIANRNARWYYYMGLVHLRKGWYDSALTNMSIASEMEPTNEEYASMLRKIKEQSNVYSSKYKKVNDDNNEYSCSCCRFCSDTCGLTGTCGACSGNLCCC